MTTFTSCESPLKDITLSSLDELAGESRSSVKSPGPQWALYGESERYNCQREARKWPVVDVDVCGQLLQTPCNQSWWLTLFTSSKLDVRC